MQLTIAQDITALQETLVGVAKSGRRVALVPTMGALHDGHLSLIEAAKQYAEVVAVSIFVNPKQFGPNEDFAKYPRMFETDCNRAASAGASLIYAPTPEDMYPDGFSTTVSPGPLGEILCGKFRPGHFDGVATVVAKLLLRVLPHVALFGEKDFQQLCIIRRLVADLDMPIEIIGVPIMREADGLAMSSRNAYLTPQEREIAPEIYKTLTAIAAKITGGASIAAAIDEGVDLITQAGIRLDYLELRTEDDLQSALSLEEPSRLLVAGWLGKTRLIDNIALE